MRGQEKGKGEEGSVVRAEGGGSLARLLISQPPNVVFLHWESVYKFLKTDLPIWTEERLRR